MPTTLGWRAASISRSGSLCPSSLASCGWTPTEHQMLSWRSAMARTRSNWSRRVPIVSMAATPAALARASTPASSVINSGKSRGLWLSISMSGLSLLFDEAREDTLWLGQRGAGHEFAVEGGERPALGRYGKLVEDLGRRVGHEWLNQQRHAPDRLGQHPHDGVAPYRIGLGERPGGLGVDIPIGVGDHFPDRRQRFVEGLLVELRAHDRQKATGTIEQGVVGLRQRA